jgi:hypothetical protein
VVRRIVEFPERELRPFVIEECKRNCCKFIKKSEKVIKSHTGQRCKYITFECGCGSGTQVPIRAPSATHANLASHAYLNAQLPRAGRDNQHADEQLEVVSAVADCTAGATL